MIAKLKRLLGLSRADEEKLAFYIRQADEAYDRMYDARNKTSAAGAYSDIKDAMASAIGLAGKLGLKDKAAELEKTLDHRKQVYRGQFS